MSKIPNRHNVVIKLVTFSVIDGALVMYLPKGCVPSLPHSDHDSLESSLNVLLEKSSVTDTNVFTEQLFTRVNPAFAGEVEIVYYTLVEQCALTTAIPSSWNRVDSLPASHADFDIASYALQRLRWKIEYTNIVYSLLPPEFTLSQLQLVYEAILGKQLDKRNFRKKILLLGILKDTKKKKISGRARPAGIYAFKNRSMTFVEVL